MACEYIDVAFEVKEILQTDPDFFFIEGLASTFGNIDKVDDIVMPGAFIESLAVLMPKILWQHNSNEPIGMPVDIREVKEGLYVKFKMPKEDVFVKGRVMPQVKVGSIDSMSIGFNIESPEDIVREGGIRMLKKISLKEISLVSFAANELALVSGFKSDKKDVFYDKKNVIELGKRGIEKALRDSGQFSKSAATYITSQMPSDSASNVVSKDDGLASISDLLKKADSINTSLAIQRILK